MHFFVNNIFFCEIAAKENVKTASYGSVIIIGVGVTAGETFFFGFETSIGIQLKILIAGG